MVGPDFRLRTDARYTELLPSGQRRTRMNRVGEAGGFTSSLATNSENEATRALFGLTRDQPPSGVLTFQSYDGTQVIGAYGPLSIKGLDLGVVVQQSTAEAFSDANKLRNLLGWLALAVLGLSLLATIIAAFFILRPLSALSSIASRIAGGDNTVRAP